VAIHVIVQISSTIVPQSEFNVYLEHVTSSAIPNYQAPAGLISVSLLQRPFVGYVELAMLSIWRSEQALNRFVESRLATDNARSSPLGVIQLEPHTYELIISHESEVWEEEDLQRE
jgi:heme-degrading monooxygenase HmoA